MPQGNLALVWVVVDFDPNPGYWSGGYELSSLVGHDAYCESRRVRQHWQAHEALSEKTEASKYTPNTDGHCRTKRHERQEVVDLPLIETTENAFTESGKVDACASGQSVLPWSHIDVV